MLVWGCPGSQVETQKQSHKFYSQHNRHFNRLHPFSGSSGCWGTNKALTSSTGRKNEVPCFQACFCAGADLPRLTCHSPHHLAQISCSTNAIQPIPSRATGHGMTPRVRMRVNMNTFELPQEHTRKQTAEHATCLTDDEVRVVEL